MHKERRGTLQGMLRLHGGLYWTRTSDPVDVNDVLYQLSQQTVFAVVGALATCIYYHILVMASILIFKITTKNDAGYTAIWCHTNTRATR